MEQSLCPKFHGIYLTLTIIFIPHQQPYTAGVLTFEEIWAQEAK
jgi:hypothetical protein